MIRRFIDTNVILRHFDGDKRALQFIENIKQGKEAYLIPSIVIAEIVWVLNSYYRLSKVTISEFIESIVQTRNLKLIYTHSISKALSYYKKTGIKFTDCMIASYLNGNDILVSYDNDFDKIKEIKRITPIS
jgi:predicted nucleic-acid-binding protein